MELPAGYPDSPIEPDDGTAYLCKGCGEILEEGKAFELAGHRWHIDCFRCNTCRTLLDSDANLLLLGDGSLICNNCTYSCSACGSKIEDLAILTGDQAYCAPCFRCRNCKRKIENLRYARTTQGMFCMECHDALMARRRKKTKNATVRSKVTSGNASLLDKSLPSLPPTVAGHTRSAFSPDRDNMSEYSDTTPVELPAISPTQDNLTLPSAAYRGNSSRLSERSELDDTSESGEAGDMYIPMALDMNPAPGPSPLNRLQQQQHHELESEPIKPRRAEGDADPFNPRSNASSRQASRENRSHSITRAMDTQSRSRSPAGPARAGGRADTPDGEGTTRRRKLTNLHSHSSESTPRISRTDSDAGRFQLQEVPKSKKSSTSKRNSRGEPVAQAGEAAPEDKAKSNSLSTALREQNPNIPTNQSARTSSLSAHVTNSQGHSEENATADFPKIPSAADVPAIPKRGDSLQKMSTPIIARKEVGAGSRSTSTALRDGASPTSARADDTSPSAAMNGGKIIGRPMESPISKSSLDFPPRSKDRPAGPGHGGSDSFSSPRAPPQVPSEGQNKHKQRASVNSMKSDAGGTPSSPRLPRSQNADLSVSEDADPDDNPSLFKRVSKSVRHNRSHSDRGIRNSKDQKWPRTPLNGNADGTLVEGLSSPMMTSPDTRDETAWYKSELRKERARIAELEKTNAEFEAALEGKSTIKQMNSELREKRSTMVVLDTQKEIVVRELDVLTEHISSAKRSQEPLDLSSLSNVVLREFAAELQKLKDSFTPQIEDLTEKKLALLEEIQKLTNQRDKTMQEFEHLSLKNSQLTELNNDLIHQLQGMHKAGAAPEPSTRTAAHGLGIYTHHQKDKSTASIDSRDLRPSIAESHQTGYSQYSGTTIAHEHDTNGDAQIVNAPRVINIRKEQPKKTFNWKKGGNVAKGVTKGLKGAFTSNESRYQREGSNAGLTEGTPYGSMDANGTPPTTVSRLPERGGAPERAQGFGFFSGGKQGKSGPQPTKAAMNGGSYPGDEPQHPSRLFGSELEARAEYEHQKIPGIIMSCIREVEVRGMDQEGIYRKSGGAAQIQIVRDGFVQSNDFDISDPDLDIAAVTSTLKQYFRKLPTPLVTYPVYDMLLESTTTPDPQERIALMRSALAELPPSHRATLEFLVFHLQRVTEREKENLMTTLNCAVVFAPTIMRPESIAREMSDTAAKNGAVQFMIENAYLVFFGDSPAGKQGPIGDVKGGQ